MTMTPQEELFKTFFNDEKKLVKDMDILELRAHREELAKIAFEARARLTADDDEEKSRKKTFEGTKPTGFSRSVNADEATKELINTVKERQKGLSKKEKLVEQLINLGYTREDAQKKVSAGEILSKFKESSTLKSENKTSESAKPEEPKKIFNPFEKKKEE